MYIAWNNRIWRGYSPIGWSELRGCLAKSKKKKKSSDTYCHRDHVHFPMILDGAALRSSYWSGIAEVSPACPSFLLPCRRTGLHLDRHGHRDTDIKVRVLG